MRLPANEGLQVEAVIEEILFSYQAVGKVCKKKFFEKFLKNVLQATE
jgi:hypothetical protein